LKVLSHAKLLQKEKEWIFGGQEGEQVGMAWKEGDSNVNWSWTLLSLKNPLNNMPAFNRKLLDTKKQENLSIEVDSKI
jgi:hypothetical protein